MLAAYLGFGWLLIRDFDKMGPGVRVFIPPFVLLGALVLPAALNARIITAGPEGVKVRNGPFPKGRKVTVKRVDILYCNVRTQYSYFESESGTSAHVENHLAGIDTIGGQIDIAYPYLKMEDATAAAQWIADGLNQDRTLASVPVTLARRDPEANSNWRRQVLSWGGLFILAALAGAAWELS